jgi:hypothetical protein
MAEKKRGAEGGIPVLSGDRLKKHEMNYVAVTARTNPMSVVVVSGGD